MQFKKGISNPPCYYVFQKIGRIPLKFSNINALA